MSTKGKGGTATLEAPAALADIPDGAIALKLLPLEEIAESPLNTRKRFDETALRELADSLQAKGQLTPVLVRPHASGHGVYELAAGHRRFRAAKLAGLKALYAIVRPMDDTTFLEVLTIENLQREDVHPLEEADGYAELIEQARYDVAKIAASVGKSERYVYDRLKLRTLAPEVRELFLADRLTPAHAIELTRIPHEAQLEAIEPGNNGARAALWETEHSHENEELFDLDGADDIRNADPYVGFKLKSVRELKTWINDHVRLDPAAEHLTMDLPATVQELEAAAQEELKVVHVTREHYVHPDARDGGRIIGPRSWKRADEVDGGPCEHAVLGVVVVGRGQGEAFKVCVAKKKCTVHWGAEIRAAKRNAKAASPGGGAARGESSWEAEQRRQRAREEAIKAAWAEVGPSIIEDVVAKLKKLPLRSSPALLKLLAELHLRGAARDEKAASAAGFAVGKTPESLLRHLIATQVFDTLDANYAYGIERAVKLAKQLGVNADKPFKAAQQRHAKAAKQAAKQEAA